MITDDEKINLNNTTFQMTERIIPNSNKSKNMSFTNPSFNMGNEFNDSFPDKIKMGDDQFENILILMNIQKIEKRDFFSEIRAQLDLDHYLDEIVIQFKEDIYTYKDILKDLSDEMFKAENIDLSYENDLSSNFSIGHVEIDLSNKIQSIYTDSKGTSHYDESWVCAIGSTAKLKRKKIGLAILSNKINLGPNASKAQFILLILSPKREKATKNSFETARTFATLFTNECLKQKLSSTKDRNIAIALIEEYWALLTNECKVNQKLNYKNEYFDRKTYLYPGRGLIQDIKKRYSIYTKDFTDGYKGDKTILKSLATTLFLYFSIILPAIAFGVLNSSNTDGKIDASRALIGQAIGGLFYALFSGQHMIVLGTTALVSLYTKVVFHLSNELEVDFYAMYACVGLWSTFFVLLYSFFGISYIIKYCTRSVEEIFAMFIMVCFTVDAARDTYFNVINYYHSPACYNYTSNNSSNNTLLDHQSIKPCEPENTLLFIILMTGTVWLSLKIYNFSRSKLFSEKQRDIISTYALPISVIFFSAVSVYIFKGVSVERFEFVTESGLQRAKIETLPINCVLICAGLGFALSILFFMDQNITGQIVNSPTNNLKKGPAPHLDLFALGILNGFLSIFALPWMHGILPQSPLHVILMSDQEEKLVEDHYERRITKVRETRITSILSNILILLSFYLIPEQIKLIPVPVLDGLFLYCAIASLRGNSFFERILLIFTEQSNYPPKFYIRRCPQKKVHLFTLLQFFQLILIAIVGYHSQAYVQMAFPLAIALLIPIRHFVIPIFIKEKFLKALEAYD